MCGVGGFVSKNGFSQGQSLEILHSINELQRHRGPDGQGHWLGFNNKVGLAHTRLQIIDLETGQQPMSLPSGEVISYNGEIYNYIELRQEIGGEFRTQSDTEVILKAYQKWGPDCVNKLRGMFAFAIWDETKKKLFVARDRFGIKPFYYALEDENYFFASEVKAILPMMKQPEISLAGLRDYFSFQLYLGNKTLYKNIFSLRPAHCGYLDPMNMESDIWKYWEVNFDLDWEHTESFFIDRVQKLLRDSVKFHLRSDVEVGAYVSGGVDSSLIAGLAKKVKDQQENFQAFTGKFSESEKFDESKYARALAKQYSIQLHEMDIVENDFADNIENVIYHLDFPVAGPGSFPQYMVSGLVKNHMKVVLGGQGGDEIFGGYARYLIAYFEQCIKGAIDGTINSGNYIVSYQSIIPNLQTLRQYKPMIKEFWADGLFDERDERYFRLINRSKKLKGVIDWSIFNGSTSFEDFKEIYWGKNVQKESYFDSMTHFDFKTLLPALLQVEDRMSMAHSVESRVPLLITPWWSSRQQFPRM